MGKEYLKSIIIRLCRQPRSFEYISKNVNGLEPVETLGLLRELESEKKIVFNSDLWVIPEVSIIENLELYPTEKKHFLQKYMGYFDFLKTPHPLDFEWRNSTESLNLLLKRIMSVTTIHDKILLLGMPTLYATAFQKDIPNTVTLIERNKPIVQSLTKLTKENSKYNVLEEDIFKVEPSKIGKHFCVVMDPPWYTPHFFQFMWLASESISIGGLVAISLPPINTRPNIPDERIEWFTFCKKIGLCLESLEPQTLQYAMPFFEFNALRAGGIENVMPFWRKGDLAIFRKVKETKLLRPKSEIIENKWYEREFRSVRIRVHITEANQDESIKNIEIKGLIKMNILPTVSSRDPIRKKANIWTSGNRIFTTNKPKLFFKILEDIAHDINNRNMDNNYKIVHQFLEMVSKLEENEFKNYIDWIYNEMERQID
jgi:hypothetical protein